MRPDINKILARPEWRGCSRRGADMGRATMIGDCAQLYLQRVRLVDGNCYDTGGAYWGSPADLYCAFSADLETMVFVRAADHSSAERAVEQLIEQRTGAEFSAAFSWARTAKRVNVHNLRDDKGHFRPLPAWQDVSLGDDGTLDTVVTIDGEEMRYSDTSEYRKRDGSFTNKGWKEFAQTVVDDYLEQLALDTL